MAEFVQREIEEMLPEMECLKKSNIFSIDETRSIMKQRKRYEYKMQRRTKEKEVYLQYIQYETNVLELIKQRRQKRKIDIYEDQIEKPIILRIYKLFRIACFRFKNDVKLWLTYVDFAKARMDKNRVSKIFTTLLQLHNTKPSLWILAAKFEFEVNESIETARQLFQRGLRFLPQSKKLWIEYFKMELLSIEVVKKRREFLGIQENVVQDNADPIEDAILSGKIAKVVFKNAMKNITGKDVDRAFGTCFATCMILDNPYFVQSFVIVAKDFNFTNELVDFIYKTLTDNQELLKTEEIQDILARRELLVKESKILKECEETGQNADFTIASFEQNANNAYVEALKTLNTEKMWFIYIDFCFERLNLKSKYLSLERFERLHEAMTRAKKEIKLSLELYIKWIEALKSFSKLKEVSDIIEEGLASYKNSVDLWKFKLSFFIDSEKSQKEIEVLFKLALDSIKEKETLVLWDLILKWSVLNKISSTEALMEKASDSCFKELAVPLRIKYLDWAFQNGGEKKVREVYQKYFQKPPFDVDFYLKYINLEQCFKNVSKANITKAYEEALVHCGSYTIDLWLEYIQFKNQSGTSEDLSSVSELYWKALKQLDQDLADEFSQKFNLLKIKLDGNNNAIEMDTTDID